MNERWRDTYDQWKTASPYEITAEQEAKLEREERECRYCDGSGFFYSEPDLGPCDCVLQASEPATSLGEPAAQTWRCTICNNVNPDDATHCRQCEYSRTVMRDGKRVPRTGAF